MAIITEKMTTYVSNNHHESINTSIIACKGRMHKARFSTWKAMMHVKQQNDVWQE